MKGETMTSTLVLSIDEATVVVMRDGEPIADMAWDSEADLRDAIAAAVGACGFKYVSHEEPIGTAAGWDIEVTVA